MAPAAENDQMYSSHLANCRAVAVDAYGAFCDGHGSVDSVHPAGHPTACLAEALAELFSASFLPTSSSLAAFVRE